MEWYYAEGQDRKGPFADEEFQRLVQQGVVTGQTLVWREGMANWEPYSGPIPPPLPSQAAGNEAICTGCGRIFPRSEVIPVANGIYCASCKTAAVQKLKEGVVATSAAEGIRKDYLKHEASVKSVGILYYIAAVMLIVVGIMGFVGAASGGSASIAVLPALFFFAMGAGQLVVGTGLRRLKSWARIPTGILSGIGLIGFPIGTLINAYILYLVFSRKGRMVFSDEYQAVIEQTPHIKYRTSIVVWILVALLLFLFGLAFFGLFFARSSR